MGTAFEQSASLKQRMYVALNDLPRAHGWFRVFGGALLILIAANALLVGVPEDAGSGLERSFVLALSVASTALFGVEYVLRLWTADIAYPEYGAVRSRVRYARSLMGIIDLLSFLPMLLVWAHPELAALSDAVRVIRLVRLVKLTRYMLGMKTIGRVITKCSRELIAAFMVMGLLWVASSVLMYEAEHAVQPEQFDSVFTGLYWAMTTMTTTGYGDLAPITPLGRLIGVVVMALSIGVVAIPAGIFSAGFVAEFRTRDDQEEREVRDALADSSASAMRDESSENVSKVGDVGIGECAGVASGAERAGNSDGAGELDSKRDVSAHMFEGKAVKQSHNSTSEQDFQC
ncbi:ion transporter [Adlercreutzia sp. ZJ141]|uniref:ion transporter n=1 Tax=Adlercreutzia sp. ZJ141 TaxID=2709406 RepID=UPI0013EDFEED|nr:ion transporter [Adlercreutzia sp. ZJ141]